MSMEIEASGQGCLCNCLCDFTFDFYWQHRGSRLDPDSPISGGKSYRQIVESLKRGEVVRISGDCGGRLCSGMGVNLSSFGGDGGPLEGTGTVVIEGDVGRRMGISMLRGRIYVSGMVDQPMGNVIEVPSDRSGYREFASITEVLEKNIPVLPPNVIDGKGIVIRDGVLRETVGARNRCDKLIRVKGNAGMSTGILMATGTVDIDGDAKENTGALMRGGRLVVRGKTGDFTAVEMKGGEIFIEGDAGSFACAKMKGGSVYARSGKAIPPAKENLLRPEESGSVAKTLEISPLHAMAYKRLGL